jgi:alpha-D-ribose 1-methylphosphonate 5-triphosphate synthase subunit PhnH
MIVLNNNVHVAQRTFRTLIAALAYPGRVMSLTDRLEAPEPFTPASAAAVVTLLDAGTAAWIDAEQYSAAAAWLREATGARVTSDPGQAQFALLDAADAASFERWNPGTPEEPEASTTLIVRVASLTGGPRVVLCGPGIDGTVEFAPQGLPPDFWPAWRTNAACYPRGIDCFFFDEHDVAGLPRTTNEGTAWRT